MKSCYRISLNTGKQLKLGEFNAEKSFLGRLAIEGDHKYVGYLGSETCLNTVTSKLWEGMLKFWKYVSSSGRPFQLEGLHCMFK